MNEIRKCVVCGQIFVATQQKMIICSNEECRRTHRISMQQEYRRTHKYINKKKSVKKKKTRKSITDIAVEARKAGMTYGQYVAIMEYGKE